MKKLLFSLVLLVLLSFNACGKTIDVGPGYTYTTISAGVAAASSGDSVHIHSSGSPYTISSAVIMKSGITLYGDGVSSTVIKMDNRDNFASTSNRGAIMCTSVSNIVIYGFSVTGGEASTSAMHSLSNTYRDYCRGISIRGGSNIVIHDFNCYLAMGDSINAASSASNVVIYNCVFNTPGHDGIDNWGGSNWHIYNVKINTFINAGIKAVAVSNFTVDHCTFYSDTSSGSGGLQIMGGPNQITVDHCIFGPMENYNGYGIFTNTANGAVSGTCAITNTIFYDCTSNYAGDVTYTTSGIQTPSSDQTATWVSQGYGYNASGSTGGGEEVPNTAYNGSTLPVLSYPPDGVSTASTGGKVTYQWSSVNSTSYHIYVSNTSSFNYLLYSSTTSDNAIALSMPNGTYYWRVSAYIDAGANAGTWTANTSYLSFSVTGDQAAQSGIIGLVYDTSTDNPISGAVVSLVSDYGNWSATTVTGANGRYQFDVPHSGTYILTASATGYQTTPTNLPVTINSTYAEENIALVKAPSYFQPHTVTFTVDANPTLYNPSLTPIKGAVISIYTQGNDPMGGSPDMTGESGSDGTITFEMEMTTNYTVVTTYQNLTDTAYIWPIASSYRIFLPVSVELTPLVDINSVISINVTKSDIVGNAATITVKYSDTGLETNSVNFSIGTYSSNNSFVPLGIVGSKDDYTKAEFTGNSAIDTWSLTDVLGQSYVIRVVYNTDNYGEQIAEYNVVFPGSNLPFKDNIVLSYGCIIIVIMITGAFGAMQRKIGPLVGTILAWAMWFLGCFQPLDQVFYAANSTAAVMFGLAFIGSVAYYMQQGDN